MKTVDANPRFKRDNHDDVLKQTEELIKRAEDVLEKLPDSDLKDEIAEKLATMKHYKHELEHAHNPIKIAHFQLELLTMFKNFKSLLNKADEIIRSTTTTTGAPTTTKKPTTTTEKPTTLNNTTPEPSTLNNTTPEPTTLNSTTPEPTTLNSTTPEPSTLNSTTQEHTTLNSTIPEPTNSINRKTNEISFLSNWFHKIRTRFNLF